MVLSAECQDGCAALETPRGIAYPSAPGKVGTEMLHWRLWSKVMATRGEHACSHEMLEMLSSFRNRAVHVRLLSGRVELSLALAHEGS